MSITIYSSGGTLKYTLKAVQASRLHQSLNGECTFELSMPGRLIQNIAIGDEVRLNDLYFTVVRIGKSAQATSTGYTVSCEHISYQLADVIQEAAHFSGTPAAVLSEILSGTGFSAGSVTVTGDWSITINNDTNKRDALQQWATACGAEISYYRDSINFLAHVGSSTPVVLSDAENVKSLAVTLDSRSATQSYGVELSRLQTLELGDAVSISYTSLDIDTTTRVITLDYDPFHPWAISMVTGDYVPDFTGAVTAALEARLKEGEPYYGVTISRADGIKIERSDGASEALFNSDVFAMRALIDGTMKDRIYFDPVRGDYVFDGALGADAVFTESLYAELGYVAELTVDRLTTSRRVRKYLLGDTSDDNYVHIQDNYIRLMTGTVISSNVLDTEEGQHLLTQNGLYIATEQSNTNLVVQVVNRYGDRLYWQREPVMVSAEGYPLDEDRRQIYSTTEVTDWPVFSFAYTEQIKSEYAFHEDGEYYVPEIVLGAGDEHGFSKGYIRKSQTGMLMRYITSQNKNVDITWNDDGFVDAMHRRLRSCTIDRTQGKIRYKVEGDSTTHTLSFLESSSSAEFYWPDGFTCEVHMS